MNTSAVPHTERPGFRANLSALRAAQKPSRGTAAYGRYVNRPAGRVVAAATHTFGLTPDGATAISASLSALGLVLLTTVEPSFPMGLGVALLLASGYVMDSVDGQLARLRGQGSVRGEWLDHTVRLLQDQQPAPVRRHLLVPLPAQRRPGAAARAPGLLGGPGGHVLRADPHALPARARPGPWHRRPRAEPATENPLRKWLILPTDYGFLCWVFVLLAWSTAFVVVYTAVFALSAAMLALALLKWWRELTAIDALGR